MTVTVTAAVITLPDGLAVATVRCGRRCWSPQCRRRRWPTSFRPGCSPISAPPASQSFSSPSPSSPGCSPSAWPASSLSERAALGAVLVLAGMLLAARPASPHPAPPTRGCLATPVVDAMLRAAPRCPNNDARQPGRSDLRRVLLLAPSSQLTSAPDGRGGRVLRLSAEPVEPPEVVFDRQGLDLGEAGLLGGSGARCLGAGPCRWLRSQGCSCCRAGRSTG